MAPYRAGKPVCGADQQHGCLWPNVWKMWYAATMVGLRQLPDRPVGVAVQAGDRVQFGRPGPVVGRGGGEGVRRCVPVPQQGEAGGAWCHARGEGGRVVRAGRAYPAGGRTALRPSASR